MRSCQSDAVASADTFTDPCTDTLDDTRHYDLQDDSHSDAAFGACNAATAVCCGITNVDYEHDAIYSTDR
jgi:hypothetical protein